MQIREFGSSIQAIQKVHASTKALPMEAVDSNDGVVGFEDTGDEVASQDKVQHNDQRKGDKMAEEKANESAEESPNFEFSGKTIEGNGKPKTSVMKALSLTLEPRLLSFNQTGFSKEIHKTTQQNLLEAERYKKQQGSTDHAPSGSKNYTNENAELILDLWIGLLSQDTVKKYLLLQALVLQ